MVPLPGSPVSSALETPRIVITPSHRDSSMPGSSEHTHTRDACMTCETTGGSLHQFENEKSAASPAPRPRPQMVYKSPTTVPETLILAPTKQGTTYWFNGIFDCLTDNICGNEFLEASCCQWNLYGKTQYRLDNAKMGIDTNDMRDYNPYNLPCCCYCGVWFFLCSCFGKVQFTVPAVRCS